MFSTLKKWGSALDISILRAVDILEKVVLEQGQPVGPSWWGSRCLWRYLGEVIDVRIGDRTIECFLNNKRIALHQRSFKPGHTTQNEHMPKAHQDYVTWTPERLHRWAQSIGPHTAQLINEVIGLHKIPQQGYRACLGILRMSKKYGKERLENAAIKGGFILVLFGIKILSPF